MPDDLTKVFSRGIKNIYRYFLFTKVIKSSLIYDHHHIFTHRTTCVWSELGSQSITSMICTFFFVVDRNDMGLHAVSGGFMSRFKLYENHLEWNQPHFYLRKLGMCVEHVRVVVIGVDINSTFSFVTLHSRQPNRYERFTNVNTTKSDYFFSYGWKTLTKVISIIRHNWYLNSDERKTACDTIAAHIIKYLLQIRFLLTLHRIGCDTLFIRQFLKRNSWNTITDRDHIAMTVHLLNATYV